MKIFRLRDILENMYGFVDCRIENESITVWREDFPQPTEEEIQAKIAELTAAEPLRLLRIERTRLLQQSDWRDLPSYPGTDQEAWRTYRQALRDITETQTPELDEFGNLTNITWPEMPNS